MSFLLTESHVTELTLAPTSRGLCLTIMNTIHRLCRALEFTVRAWGLRRGRQTLAIVVLVYTSVIAWKSSSKD